MTIKDRRRALIGAQWTDETLKLSLNDIICTSAAITLTGSPTGPYLSIDNSNKRRSFVSDVGSIPLYKSSNSGQTFTVTDYFAIPIKSGASKIRALITPSSMVIGISQWSIVSGKYYYLSSSGWQTGSWTGNITSGATHLLINCKYNSSGSVFSTEPSELEIVFSRN